MFSNQAAGESPLERAKRLVTLPQLGSSYYPGWQAKKSCRSPFREDRTPSFSVFDDDRRWKDHATGEHGDAVDFIAKAEGLSKSEAAKKLIAISGCQSGPSTTSPGRPHVSLQGARRSAPTAKAMAPEIAAMLREGVKFLRDNPAEQAAFAVERAWTEEFVARLVEEGMLAAPLVNDRRGIALPVNVPDDRGYLKTVGFQHRHNLRRSDGHNPWCYIPNASTGGGACPAAPFVLGAGVVQKAKRIIVTEGAWDALTVIHAAGWMHGDASWPEDLAVFGIRGANNWRTLVDTWGPHWAKDAKFLVLRDRDKAGEAWIQPGGLVPTLMAGGHRAACFSCAINGTKDVNDVHRVSPLEAKEIYALFNAGRASK